MDRNDEPTPVHKSLPNLTEESCQPPLPAPKSPLKDSTMDSSANLGNTEQSLPGQDAENPLNEHPSGPTPPLGEPEQHQDIETLSTCARTDSTSISEPVSAQDLHPEDSAREQEDHSNGHANSPTTRRSGTVQGLAANDDCQVTPPRSTRTPNDNMLSPGGGFMNRWKQSGREAEQRLEDYREDLAEKKVADNTIAAKPTSEQASLRGSPAQAPPQDAVQQASSAKSEGATEHQDATTQAPQAITNNTNTHPQSLPQRPRPIPVWFPTSGRDGPNDPACPPCVAKPHSSLRCKGGEGRTPCTVCRRRGLSLQQCRGEADWICSQNKQAPSRGNEGKGKGGDRGIGHGAQDGSGRVREVKEKRREGGGG